MIFELLNNAQPVATLISAIVSLLALVIAMKHLKNISNEVRIATENQKTDSLKVVLEIESQLNSRKLEFDKAPRYIRLEHEKNKDNNISEVHSDYFDATKESYFNALDRLCFCIDKKYIDDKDWRVEYRNMLRDVISAFPDDFAESSPYSNIKKINSLWQTT